MTTLEKAIRDKLSEVHGKDLEYGYIKYDEDKNEDAKSDKWSETNTSYIYATGTLLFCDANKSDWCTLIIGTSRDANYNSIEIHGVLHFKEGENADCRRVLDRALESAAHLHPIFEPKEY